MRSSKSHLAVAAAAALTAAMGCRAPMPLLDGDQELAEAKVRAARGREMAKLALAPVELGYKPTADLDKDSSRYPMRVNREAVQRGLAAAITKYTAFGEPGTVGGDDLAGSFAEAHAAGADVLVRPVFTKLDCVFRGRNWRFAPNVALFLYLWVPSFWVPDEDFAVEGQLELRFYGVASERLLYTKPVPIDAAMPLDDFERGWSWTGIVTAPSTVDPDDWARVSESLAPLVAYHAEKATALEVGDGLAPFLKGKDFAGKSGTVFALVGGVSKHGSPAITAPPGAGKEAERIAAFLQTKGHIPAKNVRMLVDAAATKAGVESALADHLGRARPEDVVFIYWTGLGAAHEEAKGPELTAGDQPATDEPQRFLVTYDAEPKAVNGPGISLRRLRELVAKLAAQRIVIVLDASFGGARPGTRSLARGGEAAKLLSEKALERFTERRDGKEITLMVASAPGEDAIDLQGTERGLFGYLFEEGAAGAADEDRSGVVTESELQAYVEREVAAQAGLEGAPQTPRTYRQGRRVAPKDPGGVGVWLPNADFEGPAVKTPAAPAKTPAAPGKK